MPRVFFGTLMVNSNMMDAVELGHWRCEFSSVFRSKVYTRHYLRNYPAAEPADEFDDRNRLYSLKGAINYSAGHPGCSLRKTQVTLQAC